MSGKMPFEEYKSTMEKLLLLMQINDGKSTNN
jgi:hypothetical protein